MTLRRVKYLDTIGQYQDSIVIPQMSIFLTTTPYSFNWVYTDIYKPWPKTRPDTLVVQAKSYENKYFPRAEYEQRKNEQILVALKMLYEGEFGKMEDWYTIV